jgi:catechol 2,3-dioxygenase-like lactoylglutathione lyase family enzyme
LARIEHVELRVRDLNESARFYRDVFGLERRAAMPPNARVCVCVGAPASGGEDFSVVLTEGLPPSTDLAGLDHVGFNAPTEQDVRGIYARARQLGFRCTAPRVFDGAFQTFVFDPDGYKIEITVRTTGQCGQPTLDRDGSDTGPIAPIGLGDPTWLES